MKIKRESSPERDELDTTMDSLVFLTPRSTRSGLLSPSKSTSPSKSIESTLGISQGSPKRGILNKLTLTNNTIVSPNKIPNGRAGLRSPQKRSLPDLDKSARKRAYRSTNFYSRLMHEEEEEEDELDEQDKKLVNRIIRNSRRKTKKKVESEEDSDEDVKVEEDSEEEAKIDDDSEESDDIDSVSEDQLLEDDEYVKPTAKRTTRSRSATPKQSPEKKQEVKAVTPSPRKVGRPRTREIKEKRRVGRPSKADEVIGKVKSIFQMDDDRFFQESKSPKKAEARKSPEKESQVNFDNTGESTYFSIPIVSGIKDKEPVKQEETLEAKFTPLPIPQLDANGNIADEEYIQKYFPTTDLLSKSSGKLTDERAFFLEGSEGYFEQHNTRVKSSVNSLSQLAPKLEYEEFIPFVKLGEEILGPERTKLNELHKSLYHQWCFELSQGFNLNFFGVGSKIDIIEDFIENYFPDWFETVFDEQYPQMLVVNGYNPSTKLKKIVIDIAAALIPNILKRGHSLKFPKHISEAVPFLIDYLTKHRNLPENHIMRPKIVLAIHNIDGESLRDEKTQNLLSQLCSLPEVWLVSSVDNFNVSLLWDLSRLKNYNFIWHDLTTYKPYSVELSFKDVLSMGKSKKFVGNKGAKYVLSSLTNNARNLYKILLQKQVETMKEAAVTKAGRAGLKGNIKLAVPFKEVHNACLEQFVTSNEISFRTILGEFIEHKMGTLTKDEAGTEMLFVPFTFDEVEQILKEEFGV